MLTYDENQLLCRVEGDAPMGQMMRRHWVPALLSEQLNGPDCDPVRVRLFGEDLVAFRDTDGRIGMLGESALTGKHRCSLAVTRSAACAACTMAGSSTSMATWSRCRPSRREAGLPTR